MDLTSIQNYISTILEFIVQNPVDVATLIGVVLSYISLNIGLADSVVNRQNALYQNFVLNDNGTSIDDLNIIDIRVREREGITYKILKYISPLHSFSGITIVKLHIDYDLPSEHRVKQKLSSGDLVLNIKINKEDNIVTAIFDETQTGTLGPKIAEFASVFHRIDRKHPMNLTLSNGELQPVQIEYYPSRYQLVEFIANKFLSEISTTTMPQGGLANDLLSFWAHDRSNTDADFTILPTLQVTRSTPDSFSPDSIDPEMKPGPKYGNLTSTWNGVFDTRAKWNAINDEYGGITLTPMENEQGRFLLAKDKIHNPEFTFQIPLQAKCMDKNEDLRLSFIAVRETTLQAYYQIKDKEYNLLVWEKEDTQIENIRGVIEPKSLTLQTVLDDNGKGQQSYQKTDFSLTPDPYKCLWMSNQYDSNIYPDYIRRSC